MRPVVAVKPTRIAWLFLLVSPCPIALAGVLVSIGHRGWAALFLVAGVIVFGRSAGVIWRWRRAHSDLAFEQPFAFVPPATNTAFVVSWAPARLHDGLSFQPGWLVIRPGWIAFLPSAPSANLLSGLALGVGGILRLRLGTTTYDFDALARGGPRAFDQCVFQLAAQGGHILRANEGDWIPWRKGAMFRASEKLFFTCDVRFPAPLLAGWRTGKAQFNARETAKAFAMITAIPALLGALGGSLAFRQGESAAMICVGVGFWWSLVVLGWVGYFVAYRRSKRAAC